MRAFRSVSLTLLLLLAAPAVQAVPTAPILDAPIPAAGQPARVEPKIPVGKTLLFPITASSPDGGRLSYAVASSNPNILVRAKTGNPVLRFNITHAGNGSGDVAYSGTMDFMLFRDWLPITSNLIAGFAQSGFYDGLLFHRLIDLGGGVGTTGFIFQSGDPLGTGSGGPGMTNGDASTAYKFQNEFTPAVIFSGRGQLAMANAGTNTGYSISPNGTLLVPDYLDSNGSQFFITDGQPRHLDFKHTTFGQMLRGWELLPLLKGTPTTSSRPNVDVKITSASVVQDETDAVLVLSAKTIGRATITVTVTTATGGRASQSFVVTAVADETNDNPFIQRVDPLVTPKDTPLAFGLQAVDLEFDYLNINQAAQPLSASQGVGGSLINPSGRVVQLVPNQAYTGLVNIGFDLRQYNVGAGGFEAVTDSTNAYVGVGDRAARPEGVDLQLQAGVAFSNVVTSKLHDTDSGGVPGNFTAQINWGDGTPLTAGTLQRDLSTAEPGVYTALGSHQYTRAGTYPIYVSFFGNNGARTTVRSTAFVSAGALSAVSEEFSLPAKTVTDRLLATFSDSAPGEEGDYIATVSWGDGGYSAGRIRRDANTGEFLVSGTHVYADSEPYAVRVRFHKNSLPANADVFASSRVYPVFTTVPHLPPFPHGKLTLAWNSGPTKSAAGLPGAGYQVTYTGDFVIINTGNVKIGASKLRFWLSDDRAVNATGASPDLPVLVNGSTQLNIIPFEAGSGGSSSFTLQIPRGQSTGRKYLLAESIYSDPIANYDGTDKVIVSGPLPASIIVKPEVPLTGPAGATLRTTESGGKATFTVQLDTPPLNSAAAGSAPNDTVTIPLESSNTAEGTVFPAQLVFNSSNWYIPQRVTVTGVADNVTDGNKAYTINLKAATSADSLYSGLVGPAVNVTNLDGQ